MPTRDLSPARQTVNLRVCSLNLDVSLKIQPCETFRAGARAGRPPASLHAARNGYVELDLERARLAHPQERGSSAASHWMRKIAPVAASRRLTRTDLVSYVLMKRWVIRNTDVSTAEVQGFNFPPGQRNT